jgi:2,4-dienoyl-CoA reductase-like NADH-dependent reductase (Old Yellow Enzyme family)/thioredoxin reductase
MSFEKVFAPIRFGKLELKNRLIIAPMATLMGDLDGRVTERLLNYYEARAKGGFSLVTVEISAVQANGRGAPWQLNVYDDSFISGLAELSERIHRHGAYAMLQLHHAGRQTCTPIIGEPPVAPSPIPCPMNRETPRELSTAEVYEVIRAFADSALRAQKAGFDAVEIHYAHGYLLSEFLSPRANQRLDEFGGGIAGRMRIAKLIVEGIKSACGEDFPVSARIDTVEGNPGGYDVNTAVAYARLAEQYGYDAFHISAGSYGEMELIIPPYDFQPAWNLEATKKIKASVQIPVFTVGRYTDPEILDYVIEQEYADVVVLGRQSISDPDYPNKLKEGRPEDIIPCLSCGQRCTAYYDPRYVSIGDEGISCVVNPFSANRPDLQIKPAEKKKKVAVVGAGPAGLEAAWVCAQRGHEVVLFEKAPEHEAGGQFRIASYPPYKHTISQVIAYYLRKCKMCGVKLNFGQEADRQLILQEKPDVLFVATGARPITPNIPGMDQISVCQANDVLLGKTGVSGSVLIVGGGQVGVELADFCTQYCDKVTVLEMLPALAEGMNSNALTSLRKRLTASGKVECHVNTKVLRFTPDGAVCEQGGKERAFDGCNAVVLAIGSRADNPFENCGNLAKEVYVIGDAKKARSAVEAFFEGAKTAAGI